MRRWIKIVAIWLIAIAVPLQGMASVAMMNCAQTPAPRQHELAEHQHNMHHDHDTAHAHTHKAAQIDNTASYDEATTKHACAHCVKCTNCCSGFTFQSNPTHLFQQLCVNETKFNDHTLPFKGFIPSGLERPPRVSPVYAV